MNQEPGTKNLKILQIFNQYRFRGGEEAWVDRIPALLEGIAEVEELRFHSDAWLGANAPSPLKQIYLMGNNPSSRAALREHARRFKPDVLLFHNVIPVGSFGLYFEAKALGIPVLQYTHNFRPFSPGGTLWTGKEVNDAAMNGNPWPEIFQGAWQGSRLKTAILAWHLDRARKKGLLECVDHWLAISDFMRDQFIEAGIPVKKITSLRHCSEYDLDMMQNPNSEEGESYLFLGRLVTEKGIGTLLDAWQLLESELGNRCPKLFIAGNGPLEEEVRARNEKLSHVECVGFVDGDAKQKLLSGCRAMIIPAIWWEPLGLTTYDSYAFGRPVIASRAGALQETVQDGVTGWTFEAANAPDLARAILEAEAAGAAERKRRGLAGLTWLKQHASPEEWRSKLLDTLEEVMLPTSFPD